MSEYAYYSWGDDELDMKDHAITMSHVVGPNGTLIVATAEGSTVISRDGSTTTIDPDGVFHAPVLDDVTPVTREDK